MLRLSLCFAALAPFCVLSACTGGTPKTGPEICDNREDDDGDGKIDCDDSDCANDPACSIGGGEGEGQGGEGEGQGGEGEGQGGEGEGEGGGADVCGDGVVGVTEECDRNNLAGENCVSLGRGFTGGALRCAVTCTFDTSGCTADVGEGEGEGAGEGEGEGAAGEGEGEGAAGEGEGEGAAGEGEGEGTVVDEAGGVDAPTHVTLEFTTTVNIDPENDTDCFQFTIGATSTITINADDGADGSGCGDFGVPGLDPDVTLFSSTDTTTPVGENDDRGDFCSSLTINEDAGTYIACVQRSPFSDAVPQDGIVVDITATPVVTQPGDVGDLTNPKAVTLDFTENTDLVSGGGAPDVDCYAFNVPTAGTLTIETFDAANNGTANDLCPQGGLDTDVQLFDVTTAHNLLGDNDDKDLNNGNFCSRLVAAVPAGNLIACVTTSTFLGTNPPDVNGIEVDGSLQADTFPPVFISEVADPVQPTNGNARFVELFNPATTDDVFLVGSRLRVFSNGNVTAQNVNISRGAVVRAGSTYVIAHNATDYATQFPTATPPDQVTGSITGNGNDAYELDLGGVAVDVYGVIGQDGVGQPWEYTDGDAQRNANVAAPSTTFNVAEWTVVKAQANDAAATPGAR